MQKETEKQMYSAPSSELLELVYEGAVCNTISKNDGFDKGGDPLNSLGL